jgi:ABC-2 type transport system ATP-binding protein
VEQVCNRVAIIKQGELLTSAPVRELLSHGQRLRIKVDNPEEAAGVLRALPWVNSVLPENGYLTVDAPKDSGREINKALAGANIYLSELVVQSATLESVFLELTGGETGD